MNDQNDILIIDAVERYIRGEMNPDERLHFENLRKTNGEIDQLVVEHTLFLQQMNRFGEWKNFQASLQEIHTDLAEQGKINSERLKGKARVVYLWNKYKRVAAIAASIAGVTALSISSLVWSISPKTDIKKLQDLSRDLQAVKIEQRTQKNVVNTLKNQITVEPAIPFKSGGTGFLIDSRGYLVTNAHVVKNAKNIGVQNKSGQNLHAIVVYEDVEKDLAILKIEDESYRPLPAIPYSISRSSADLATPIFTLGYPRDEIVYGEGYLSAKTGFNGDTLSCQVSIPANPGNSGGPVLNSDGEIIGILSTRETAAEGVVFALQAKHIFKALSELKKDTSFNRVKVPTSKSSLAGLDRSQQVKRVEDFVFMVKVN
jgi:Trypsin-like serine proteases, typically periplasmic, contain C-terminal PDZ domain